MPGEIQTEFPLEKIVALDNFDLTQPIPGCGREGYPDKLNWQPMEHRNFAPIDFGPLLDYRNHVAGYAVLRVYVARTAPKGIIFGADDQHRLWLNGQLISEGTTDGTASPDKHAIPARFQHGWNTLVAKVVNATGMHELFLSFSDNSHVLADLFESSSEQASGQKRQELLAAAGKMWDEAHAGQQGDHRVALRRASFLARQHSANAEQALQDVVTHADNEAVARRARAAVYMDLDQPEKAIIDLDRAVELMPASVIVREERGFAHARLGNLRAAIDDFEYVIARQPNEHWIRYLMTTMLLMIDDVERYKSLRAEIVDKWQDTDNPTLASRTCKSSSFLRPDDDMLSKLDRLMRVAMDAGPEHEFHNWFLYARGALEYRHGQSCLDHNDETGARERFLASLNALNTAQARQNFPAEYRLFIELFRAMAIEQLARLAHSSDESSHQQALQHFLQIERSMADNGFSQSVFAYERQHFDTFMILIVHRECVRLLFGPQSERLDEAGRLLEAGDTEAGLIILDKLADEGLGSVYLLQRMLTLVDQYVDESDRQTSRVRISKTVQAAANTSDVVRRETKKIH
jgi:tetratricopeptide (TPR) repeat protein